jgi:hypothetical protein
MASAVHFRTAMKKLIVTLGLTGLMLSVSGCILHSGRPHGHRHSAVSQPSCRPNQYWDGNQCRHKGKGHGARKHDGR